MSSSNYRDYVSPKQSLQEQFGYVPPPKLTHTSCTDTPLHRATKCSAPATTAALMNDMSAAQCINWNDDNLDELAQLTDEYGEIDSDFFNISDDDVIVMDSGRMVPTTAQPKSDKTHLSYSNSRRVENSFPQFPYPNKEIVSKCSIEDATPSFQCGPVRSSASSVLSYQVNACQTNRPAPVSVWSDLPYPGGRSHCDRQANLQHQIDKQPSKAGFADTHANGSSLSILQTPSSHAARERVGDTASLVDTSSSVKQIAHRDECDPGIAAFFTAGPVK